MSKEDNVELLVGLHIRKVQKATVLQTF